MDISAGRWTSQDGDMVSWGNVIGGMNGQSGTFRFATEDEAERFAAWAKTDFPSMGEADLANAGFTVIEKVAAGHGVT